jgi:hypothetical protein
MAARSALGTCATRPRRKRTELRLRFRRRQTGDARSCAGGAQQAGVKQRKRVRSNATGQSPPIAHRAAAARPALSIDDVPTSETEERRAAPAAAAAEAREAPPGERAEPTGRRRGRAAGCSRGRTPKSAARRDPARGSNARCRAGGRVRGPGEGMVGEPTGATRAPARRRHPEPRRLKNQRPGGAGRGRGGAGARAGAAAQTERN